MIDISPDKYEILTEQPTWEFLAPFVKYTQLYFPTTICKYYNEGEQRIKNIPDILDTIDAELDRLEDLLELHRKCAVYGSNVYNRADSNMNPAQIRVAIQRLSDVRDRVLDGEDVFYSFNKPERYSWAGTNADALLNSYSNCVKPIKRIKMKQLYRFVFDNQTKKWHGEPDDRDEPKYGVMIDGMVFYNRVKVKGEWRAVPFEVDVWAYYNNFYEFAVAETPEQIDETMNKRCAYNWSVCEKCGKIFKYNPDAAYLLSGKVPKLCKNCFNGTKKK